MAAYMDHVSKEGFAVVNGAGKKIDLLGFGIAAVDDVIELDHYPAAGCKMPIQSIQRHGGGQCTTALVTAARLGLCCVYGGPLGEDVLSAYTRQKLEQEGIQVVQKLSRPAARPYHSLILVDRASGERTILYSGEGVSGPAREDIDEDLIRRSRMLYVDQLGPEGTLHACHVARQCGVPIVADLEQVHGQALHEILALTDHAIFSMRVAQELTGKSVTAEAVSELARTRRACTVVTDGARGCWFVTGEQSGLVRHQPAFKVPVKDTTGCGDVFHGAYAAGLLSGLSISEAIGQAAATAALKATRVGGQQGIPDRATVDHFLRTGALI